MNLNSQMKEILPQRNCFNATPATGPVKNNYSVALSMYIFITWYKLVGVGLCSYK